MNAYLPALPAIVHDLELGSMGAQTTLTTYLAGMACGQLAAGSLSDRFGRRPILVAGMLSYGGASLVCAFAPNLSVLAGGRFAQGVAAASAMTLSRAVVRDLHTGAMAARRLSQLMVFAGLGPILAPIVGAQIVGVASWRWVFVVLALGGLSLAVFVTACLPETLPRNRRLAAMPTRVRHPYELLMNDSEFRKYCLIIGFGSGAMAGYIGASPFVYQSVFGLSPSAYGWTFGLLAIAVLAGAQVNTRRLLRETSLRMLRYGVGIFGLSAILFTAAAYISHVAIAVFLAASALLMFGWSFIITNALALALEPFSTMAGTAAAALGVTQFTFGAITTSVMGVAGGDARGSLAFVIVICWVGVSVTYRNLERSTLVATEK